MALSFYLWNRTAASNATADPSVNWQEGMLPSAVNDSARAMMASTAAFRDDIAGAITTGGTSTAYTVSSYQVFDTLVHLNGQMIAFTPHATNGATVTLNVDGLGAKPLRSAPSVELLAGTLILGTPYLALYNNSDAAWYLQGFFGNPYNVPLAGCMDYFGTVVPNSSFIFPLGQALSRTTYAAAFAILGTTYGSGDGSTTFNAPDLGGRVTAMKEATAARLTTAGSGIDGGTMGSAGGSQNGTILQANFPLVNFTVTGTFSGNTTAGSLVKTDPSGGFSNSPSGGGSVSLSVNSSIGNSPVSGTISGTAASGGSGTAFNICQPTLVCNKILRVI